MLRYPSLVVVTLLVALAGAASRASAAAAPANEMDAAVAAARKAMKAGPVDVPVLDQATLKLPEGFVYVPKAESAQLLRAMGNHVGGDLVGTVFPAGRGDWFVVMQYEKSGYIKDDDAKHWDAAQLLQNLKDGTEAANKERKARGIPEMEVIGWVEAPHYDAAAHRLIWSVSSKDKGAPADASRDINYNTYALGRDGYISMNLVTNLKSVDADKVAAQRLLRQLAFHNGKRYADFNAATDHVAEYGLAALIGGIAAKKLGLFALGAAFFAKFFKLILVGFAAAGGAFSKLWKRRKDGAPKA